LVRNVFRAPAKPTPCFLNLVVFAGRKIDEKSRSSTGSSMGIQKLPATPPIQSKGKPTVPFTPCSHHYAPG
jgi:hypothetical protein